MAIKTINICDKFNESLPKNSPYKELNTMLIYDTYGLKPKVKENNPKTIATFINNQKLYAKVTKNKNHNPYAVAYKAMPKYANANSNIKLDFVNDHFGYFYKFEILTNGLGIPLAIHFFDENFYSNIQSEFETPEEQKYFYDNATLKSVIKPFLSNLESNCNFRFNTFLGDSEFDSYENFGLLKELNFQKVFISINSRNQKNSKIKDFKLYAGVQRNSTQWVKTYKIRAIIERLESSA